MLGWFKSGRQEDVATIALEVADSAVIEPVFNDGLYTTFLIRITEGRDLAPHLKNQTALAAFVERIEARIDASDFEPVLEAINNVLGAPCPDHSEDRSRAVRAVVSNGGPLLFKWSR